MTCKKCKDCDCKEEKKPEDAIRWPSPWPVGPWPKRLDGLPEPYFGKPLTICPKCGLDVSGVMGYVCPDMLCPIFPKVVC